MKPKGTAHLRSASLPHNAAAFPTSAFYDVRASLYHHQNQTGGALPADKPRHSGLYAVPTDAPPKPPASALPDTPSTISHGAGLGLCKPQADSLSPLPRHYPFPFTSYATPLSVATAAIAPKPEGAATPAAADSTNTGTSADQQNRGFVPVAYVPLSAKPGPSGGTAVPETIERFFSTATKELYSNIVLLCAEKEHAAARIAQVEAERDAARRENAELLRKLTERRPLEEQVENLTQERMALSHTVTHLQRQLMAAEERVALMSGRTLPTVDEVAQMAPRELEAVTETLHVLLASAEQARRESRLCAVCLARSKTVIFLPCRHEASCEECADPIDRCPICRVVIENKIVPFR